MRLSPLLEAGIVVGNRFDQTGAPCSVLEVGCGEGHVTELLANRFPQSRVLGTDFSQAILTLARHEHPGLEFAVSSIYDVPGLGRWDLVVACEVFEHLDDPARALDAVCAVAQPWVVVTVPREPLWRVLNVMRGQYLHAWGNTDGHVQHWSRGQLLEFLSTRLEIVDTRAPLPWTQVLGRVRAPRGRW
jgi:trans-aconitate methyltransferase